MSKIGMMNRQTVSIGEINILETVIQEHIHVHKEGVFVINELNGMKDDCAQPEETAAAAEPQTEPVQDSSASVVSDGEKTGKSDGAGVQEDFRENLNMDEERYSPKRFWRFRSGNDEVSRDKLILSRIKDEDLMEYLALEQRRVEFLQQVKEAKEKRILDAFRLVVTLAAIVALTYFLQDNPTILISILYVAGIVAALKVWRNPQDKGRGDYH